MSLNPKIPRPNAIFLFLLAFLLSWSSPAWTQDNRSGELSQQKIEAIDSALTAEMKAQKVIGLAVGVIQNGRIVYLNGYGWADRKNQVPVGPQTLFRWASISKTLTAVRAFQLAEEGKLDLSADVRTYLPEFPDKGVTLTARDLLCHQSGLPHYNKGVVVATKKVYDVAHPFEDVTVALDKFKDSPLLFAPGEQVSYSSCGYITLSAIVQRAGEQKFADQIQRSIAEPLGLTTLQPDYRWRQIPHRAVGYVEQNEQIVESTDTDVSWKLGAGGYLSNIGDLALFGQGLIQQKLLTPRSYSAMWQAQTTKVGEKTDWGLGFVVQTDGANRFKVSHDGGQEKARCRMVLYPQLEHGVVVMSNCENAVASRFSTAVYAALASTP